MKKELREQGPIPYYGANGIQGYVADWIFDGTFLLMGEDGSVINPDKSPVLNWVSGKIWVNNHAHVLAQIEGGPLLRFIYHVLTGNDVSGIVRGTPPKINQNNLRNIRIPVPPIEIQEEIVRVLDSFAELEAELEARKAQYAYYRDKLLTFDNNAGGGSWLNLGEVFDMKAGKAIAAKMITESKDANHLIKCFGANGFRGYVANANQQGASVLIGRQGALCGNVCFADGDFYATEHAVVVKPKVEMDMRYAYHALLAAHLSQYKTAGAQPGLSVARLKNVKAFIPPLEEQERIVAILDKFDTLVNDISEGLPAEIEVRHKQYEYYRDKLLSFKEKAA